MRLRGWWSSKKGQRAWGVSGRRLSRIQKCSTIPRTTTEKKKVLVAMQLWSDLGWSRA